MMVCTEGNTNRECSFFLGGMVGLWVCGHCGMEENKKSGGGDARASKPAIGDGVLWATPCKRKAQPEAQLGAREAKVMSLGEGRLWQVFHR